MKRIYLATIGLAALLLTVSLQAATITATSCSLSAVSAAISSASNGDTVVIPAGTCTWTSQLTITKGITLLGAGIDATILNDNVPKGQSGANSLIYVTVNAPQSIRLSGFTLNGVAPSASTNDGHLRFVGTSKALRVDHIKFTNLRTGGIYINGDHWGVVDHNDFDKQNFNNGVIVKHYSWGGSSFGDGSWAEPWTPGDQRAIFIEDNRFDSITIPTAFVGDCGDGGRMVIRHNTLINSGVQNHGTSTGQRSRSCRSAEVYDNTFEARGAIDAAIWWEGGTGVFYNNTVTDNSTGTYNSFFKTINDRAFTPYPPWGICDGSSPYDGNSSGQKGYRCADQVGAGTSRHLNGLDTPTPQSVGNVLDPAFVWNNTLNDKTVYGSVTSDSPQVQVGRDVVTSARPNYTPYVYPHPLVSGAPAPPPTLPVPTAPANLRLIR